MTNQTRNRKAIGAKIGFFKLNLKTDAQHKTFKDIYITVKSWEERSELSQVNFLVLLQAV